MTKLPFKRSRFSGLKTLERVFVKLQTKQYKKSCQASRLRASGNKMRLLEVILKNWKLSNFEKKWALTPKPVDFSWRDLNFAQTSMWSKLDDSLSIFDKKQFRKNFRTSKHFEQIGSFRCFFLIMCLMCTHQTEGHAHPQKS